MNIKKTLSILALSFTTIMVSAQSEGVSIAPTVVAPHPSAMLEVQSENKGILIPRVTLIALNDPRPITDPLKSLMVFNEGTNVAEGYYYWSGSEWILLRGSEEWKVIGSSGTMSNGQPIPQFKSGYSSDPSSPLLIRKNSDGDVEIQGRFIRDANPASGGFIFDLPIGYQPIDGNYPRAQLENFSVGPSITGLIGGEPISHVYYNGGIFSNSVAMDNNITEVRTVPIRDTLVAKSKPLVGKISRWTYKVKFTAKP